MNIDAGTWLNTLVTFILGGGAFATYREFRQRRQEKRAAIDGAPEKRARADSVVVGTAESVVELVKEQMTTQAKQINNLEAKVSALSDEVVVIRRRADRAERRVEVLTRLIRDNAPHLEIPPEENP